MRGAVLIAGGSLLAAALLIHGSGGAASAPASERPAVRARDEKPEEVGREPVFAQGDLVEERDLEERKEAVRDVFWKYRSAVACDDEAAERALYPLLLLDRDTSLECAREEVDRAPTELDLAIARKAEQALKERISRSEEP